MKTEKIEVRIVAGNLRGRKISLKVSDDLRPTPQMVREAFFSILGNAVPDRLFIDIFAGSGVVGIEALSRGAKAAYLIERDFTFADGILSYLKKFDLMKRSKLFRTDAYRWISSFKAPPEPINIFFSPPFVDLTTRPEVLADAVAQLQEKVAVESVIVLQSEKGSPLDEQPELLSWERRTYGRNILLIWQKEETPPAESGDEPETPID